MYSTPIIKTEKQTENSPNITPEISSTDLNSNTAGRLNKRIIVDESRLIIDKKTLIGNADVNFPVDDNGLLAPAVRFGGAWESTPQNISRRVYGGLICPTIDGDKEQAYAQAGRAILVGFVGEWHYIPGQGYGGLYHYLVSDESLVSQVNMSLSAAEQAVEANHGQPVPILPINQTYTDYTKLCIINGICYIETVVAGIEHPGTTSNAHIKEVGAYRTGSYELRRVISEIVPDCNIQVQLDNFDIDFGPAGATHDFSPASADAHAFASPYETRALIKITNYSAYPRLIRAYLRSTALDNGPAPV